MKNLSKVFLPLAGFVLMGTSLLQADDSAGSPPPPPPPPGEHRERREENAQKMAKELNLTPDQQTQIEAIRKQTREAVKGVRNDASLSDDQKHAKTRELMKAGEEQVRAILTPEQQAKAKELRAKHGRHAPGDGSPPPPTGETPPPPAPPAN